MNNIENIYTRELRKYPDAKNQKNENPKLSQYNIIPPEVRITKVCCCINNNQTPPHRIKQLVSPNSFKNPSPIVNGYPNNKRENILAKPTLLVSRAYIMSFRSSAN